LSSVSKKIVKVVRYYISVKYRITPLIYEYQPPVFNKKKGDLQRSPFFN
jgi:hypothetical protein